MDGEGPDPGVCLASRGVSCYWYSTNDEEKDSIGTHYSRPPYPSTGGMFPDPQWMPEIMNSTEPYVLYYVIFLYTHTYLQLSLIYK